MRDQIVYAAMIPLAVILLFGVIPLVQGVDWPIEARVARPATVPGSIDGCYTVKRGDNAGTLSVRFWGDWKFFRHLLETNGREYNGILVIGEKVFIDNAAFDQKQLEPPSGCPTPTPSPIPGGSASTEASR